LRTQIEKEESEFEKENLQERLAKLVGGVAVIKVGAATEVEQKAKSIRQKTLWLLQERRLKKEWCQGVEWLF